MSPFDPNAEWLETDGLGGFASGTVSGVRTRRYHALLLTATTPPGGRVVLVNGFDAWVETAAGENFAISSQRYAPNVVHPDGAARVESFEYEPWPRWRFRLTNDLAVDQELFVLPGRAAVMVSWKLVSENTISPKLKVRPFLSGRDFHSTHHENAAFRFTAETHSERILWRPYDGLPAISSSSNGSFSQEPTWYRNFLYTEEGARGLDATEDLASPGVFEFILSKKPAVLMFEAVVGGGDPGASGGEHAPSPPGSTPPATESVEKHYLDVRTQEEHRRRDFASPLERAAAAYLVRRGEGKTLIAGYPWFGDWGRDTFIALRGLCLVTGRLKDARDILVEWAGLVSEGMLPNRFPDRGEPPEFNSVDASLWYIIAVYDYLQAVERHSRLNFDSQTGRLRAAIEAILSGYSSGTRFGIREDGDGLLSAGEPGCQLTWMDARVNGREITPRIGKPVEIQALWLNALAIGARFSSSWRSPFETARAAFEGRFWIEHVGFLADVIDCNHQPGAIDLAFRPNQIFAVGGLPLTLLSPEKARRVVDVVEMRLLTPVGLRSLAPGEPGYTSRYAGGVAQRDASYHQGTVWPWLIGPFVEAWIRVRGETAEAKAEARERFLKSFHQHLNQAGLGHVSEIADADPPHTPRGCPFQAWSLGELLRLERQVLI
jgi:predicted glycogen debranching enzyme